MRRGQGGAGEVLGVTTLLGSSKSEELKSSALSTCCLSSALSWLQSFFWDLLEERNFMKGDDQKFLWGRGRIFSAGGAESGSWRMIKSTAISQPEFTQPPSTPSLKEGSCPGVGWNGWETFPSIGNGEAAVPSTPVEMGSWPS